MNSNHLQNGSWPTVPLGKVATVQKGKKPSTLLAEQHNAFPYLEAAVLRKQRGPYYVSEVEAANLVCAEEMDTLILWDGAKAGDIFPGQKGIVASTMARLRPVSRAVHPEFLYFYFLSQSSYLHETAAGSTVPHVRGRIVKSMPVPLPALPVQERIVEILQKAREIGSKRKTALDLVDAILSSSFVAMFGDPSENQKRYERVPLGELADIRSGVTKGRKLHGEKTVVVPYLRVANVQDGYLDLSEVKTIEVLPDDVEKYHLEDGDILMTEGGDPDKLGRGCIWRNQIDDCIHQNHIFRVRTKRSLLAPEYLAALLRTRYAKHYFLSCAKRSSNLASVNSTQVKAFPVPLPPIQLQKKFVMLVEQWILGAQHFTNASREAADLFDSLMLDAFTGKLTSAWEAENAEWIEKRQTFYERLPQMVLLAFLLEKARRAGRRAAEAAVLVTALMKYAFLLQMEGNGRRRLYNFVPYHYGPFAKELYTDLGKLQREGLVNVDTNTDEEKTRITLSDPDRAQEILTELPDDLKEDIGAVLDAYGDLDHNTLIKTVYEKYPAYAKKSRVRRRKRR